MSQIEKVRKSIQHRKKNRGFEIDSKKEPLFEVDPAQIQVPQDIEKHGYLQIPEPTNVFTKKPKEETKSLAQLYVPKAVLALMLFVGVAFIFGSQHSAIETPKRWIGHALTEDFQFAKANLWYEERFGKPFALQREIDPDPNETRSEETLPVSGNVKESFQANGMGIMIEPTEVTQVTTVDDGVVVFAGKDRQTDKTVVVQHADGSKSTYGFLSKIDVHLYQHVRGLDAIGQFDPNNSSETVFFSIEKDKQYIDPVQVIQVDGS